MASDSELRRIARQAGATLSLDTKADMSLLRAAYAAGKAAGAA